MFDVRSELEPVAARWKHVGLALRLDPGTLDVIERDGRESSDCLTKVLALWLKRNYKIERFGSHRGGYWLQRLLIAAEGQTLHLPRRLPKDTRGKITMWAPSITLPLIIFSGKAFTELTQGK